jgi:hypothetical protein
MFTKKITNILLITSNKIIYGKNDFSNNIVYVFITFLFILPLRRTSACLFLVITIVVIKPKIRMKFRPTDVVVQIKNSERGIFIASSAGVLKIN